MGLPGIAVAHGAQAVSDQLPAEVLVAQDTNQGVGHGPAIQGVDQEPVLAVADDVDRTAVLGGDQRQSACRGFQEGQSEGLGQGRIDKDASGTGDEPIDLGHLLGAMVFGGRNLAVEIVGVDGQQDVRQNGSRALVEVANIVSVAGDNQQVGECLELGRFAVGLEQCDDVLAVIGPGKSQNQRLGGLIQEAVDVRGKTDRRTVCGRWVKLDQVGARRDHDHALGLVVIVEDVLLLDLVVGAGDDQLRRAQDALLGLDATHHVVACIDLLAVEPGGEQALAFIAPQ